MHDILRQFVTQVLSPGQTLRVISLMGLDLLKEKTADMMAGLMERKSIIDAAERLSG